MLGILSYTRATSLAQGSAVVGYGYGRYNINDGKSPFVVFFRPKQHELRGR
jgi:hypothetical protein